MTFPLASRVDVQGPAAHPVFQFLTAKENVDDKPIQWNFEKWLVGRSGHVVARWGSAYDDATAASIQAAVERELGGSV